MARGRVFAAALAAAAFSAARAATSKVQAAPQPLVVGTTRQLFFDDAVVDTAQTNASRTARTFDAGDDPQIVLRMDMPWEVNRTLDYFAVAQDPQDGLVKVWYSIADGCGYNCNRSNGEEDGLMSYATSTDGVNFDKPLVGETRGGAKTNILGRNPGGPGVFLNTKPGAPPSERFVSLGKCHDSTLCKGPLSWVTSPDGVHWPNLNTPSTCASTRAVDTQMSTFWDPSAGAYVSYTRDRYGTGRAIRRVRRVVASGFGAPGTFYPDASCPWQNTSIVIDIDAVDNATHPGQRTGDLPPMDYYGAAVWRREMGQPPQAAALSGERGNRDFGSVVYWAFTWRFWHFDKDALPGTKDIGLMVSRDGLTFSHVNNRNAFVRTGRDGTAGSRRVRVAPTPVVVNDTVLVYLFLTNLAEDPNRTTDGRPVETVIGVVRLRLDGFVSMDAEYAAPAIVTTVPVVVGGPALCVNVEAPNGALRAALVKPDGTAIPGFSFDDSVSLCVDSVNATLAWSGKPGGVAELVGEAVKIVFWLVEAKLYSFQWCR